METGELDALFSVYIPKIFRNGSPSIARLWPNFKAVETDYYRRTGIFPVMHIVAIREDVHRANPWVAQNLYKAFCAARDLAVEGLYDSDALHLTLPFLLDHVEEAWRVFGRDFGPTGLRPTGRPLPPWAAMCTSKDWRRGWSRRRKCFCRGSAAPPNSPRTARIAAEVRYPDLPMRRMALIFSAKCAANDHLHP